ncbi:MAG: hypothetical protein ACI9OE_001935 [Mariniflexile sp.]|jgi:hypothetical protein
MEKSILLHNLTPDDLKQIIKGVLKDEFNDFKKYLDTYESDKLLTREETCELLKINPTTLWHWTNNGKVTCYGIASRRYCKKNELLEQLIVLKAKRG